MRAIQVYVVRHGETEENRLGIIQGHIDTPLNQNGRDQAQRLSEELKSQEFTWAYSSDLSRAAETAEIVLKHHPGPKLIRQTELRERHFGDLQGTVRVSHDYGATVEPLEDFITRSLNWWDTTIIPLVARDHDQDPQFPAGETPTVLVIGHGSFIKNLLKALASRRGYDTSSVGSLGRIPNTGISIVKLQPDGTGSIVQYGNAKHLEGLSITQTNADDVDQGPQ